MGIVIPGRIKMETALALQQPDVEEGTRVVEPV